MAQITATTTTFTLNDRRGNNALQLVIVSASAAGVEIKLTECLHCDADIWPRDNTVEAHEQFASEMVSHTMQCKKPGRTLPLSPDRPTADFITCGPLVHAR